MLPWLDTKDNLLNLNDKSTRPPGVYVYLAILLALGTDTCTQALAEGREITTKHACPSTLLARDARAAHPVFGCQKDGAFSPSSLSAPQIAPPERPRQGHAQEHKARLFVFVSLSMPEASLKRLGQEAKTHKATLVMRGLYEDSFAKTAQKIQKLGIAVDINPELFEAHNITVVPTFVWTRNGHPVQILKGNVTLAFAVKKLESRDSEGQQSIREAR